MSDISDPRTIWLGLTNVILGLVTLTGLVLVGQGLLEEIRDRKRRRSQMSETDHVDAHESLGVTMADGGERAVGKPK